MSGAAWKRVRGWDLTLRRSGELGSGPPDATAGRGPRFIHVGHEEAGPVRPPSRLRVASR